MRTSAIIVGLSLLFAPIDRGGGEQSLAATGSEIPCGQCHDYRYTSDIGLYDPFWSHAFGGGGVALRDDRDHKSEFIMGDWRFVASSWSADQGSAHASRESLVTLASLWRDAPECPTAGAQSCEHLGGENVECNSPSGHGCHDSFGAGMCSGSHYPCRYPPGGWPESAAMRLQSSNAHSVLAQGFRELANASTFAIEDGKVSFFGCDGSLRLSVALHPALDRAIAAVMNEGLFAESRTASRVSEGTAHRSDNL